MLPAPSPSAEVDPLNRTQLQALAEERARDALALLHAGQWSGAFYLAGYAVECGLKACIAKQTNKEDFPDLALAKKIYTHDFNQLLDAAGLKSQRAADQKINLVLGRYWLMLNDWSESARYQQWPEINARNLVQAVTDPTNGVLQWIRGHW